MPFSPKNFLIERRKTKPKSTEDELAVIKAAAWAWYERGSGSEGKPIREFDFTNSRRNPNPSRYKIEAMMKNATNDENSSLKTSRTSISISSCPSYNSSLMDNYEIESISKDLGHYIESCDHDSSAPVGHGSAHHGRVVAVSKIEKGEVVTVSSKVKSRKLSKGGFLSRHAAVCGSLNDVVTGHRNNIVVGIRERRQPEKRAPVVDSSSPVPSRVPHAL